MVGRVLYRGWALGGSLDAGSGLGQGVEVGEGVQGADSGKEFG